MKTICQFQVAVYLLLNRLVCGCWGVWLDLWVLSLSFIGDISHISTISIDRVGNLLQATIRKRDVVRPLGSIAISLLFCAKVSIGVIILHSKVVSVQSWLIRIGGLSTIGWGTSRGSKGGSNKGRESIKNL